MQTTVENNVLRTKPIPVLMFQLAIPAIISQFVNVLYNIVDRIYIGHIPHNGLQALTGIGICFPILILISAFSQLVAAGASLASIQLGKKNKNRAEEILGNGFCLLLLLSIFLTILFQLLKYPILKLFGASASTLPFAMDYLSIYLMGTVFVQLTLGLNPYIICQGRSKTAMLSILFGACLNLILDPIFIFYFGMGVKGAAIANVLSQMVSAIWIIRFLISRKSAFRLKRIHIRIQKEILKEIVGLGISTFVMSFTECLINIAYNTSLHKYGGDNYIAAMTIMQSAIQIACIFANGLTQGLQPIISYNFGAGDILRVKKAYRSGFLLQILISSIFCIFFMQEPEFIANIFTSKNEVINIVKHFMPVFICGWGIFGIQSAAQCAFVSMGQAKASLFLACLRKIILMIPLIIILPEYFGLLGIFLSEPISDITSAVTAGLLFSWRIKHVLGKNATLQTS